MSFSPQKSGLVQEPTVEGNECCGAGWAWRVWGNGKQKEMGRFDKDAVRGEVGDGYRDTSHHIYQSGE